MRKAYPTVVAGLVLVLAACTSTISGTPQPVGGGAPGDAIPAYQPDPDGAGWPAQAIDQPRPLPGRSWNWTRDSDRGMCQFADDALLNQLGWNGGDLTPGPACGIPTGPATTVQIELVDTYQSLSAFDSDRIAFMRPITIDGLEAREYDLDEEQDKYPGSCEVMVNTRSLTSFVVLVGTPEAPGTTVDPAPQCAKARQDATLLAEKFVPLAGGTPWPKTPQTLSAKAVLRHTACDLLGYGDLVAGGVYDDKGTPTGGGASCTYRQDELAITVRTHRDQALDAALQQAEPTDGPTEQAKLGGFPAAVKLAAGGATCTEAAQVTRDLAVSVSYTNAGFKPAEVCKAAQGVLGGGLATLMDAP